MVHNVAARLHDCFDRLAFLRQRSEFCLLHPRGNEAYRGSATDARSSTVRDIYIPDLSLDATRVSTRDFGSASRRVSSSATRHRPNVEFWLQG